MGCHFLLQGIFPTQGSSQGFLHCRQILYRWSHQGLRKVNVHTFFTEPSMVSHWLPCHAPYVRDSLGFHVYWPYLNELPCEQCSNSWSVTVFYTQDTWAQSPRTGAHPQTSATEGGRRLGEQLGSTQDTGLLLLLLPIQSSAVGFKLMLNCFVHPDIGDSSKLCIKGVGIYGGVARIAERSFISACLPHTDNPIVG